MVNENAPYTVPRAGAFPTGLTPSDAPVLRVAINEQIYLAGGIADRLYDLRAIRYGVQVTRMKPEDQPKSRATGCLPGEPKIFCFFRQM
jgi:hypothetical protein